MAGSRGLANPRKTCGKDEGTLSAIYDSSPNAITVTDLMGRITECNQATLDLHGYSSREELLGKSAFQLIAAKDHERALKNLNKTLKQGSIRNVEYTFVRKDEQKFPAELSASVIKDPCGNPSGFVAITRNITGRKKAERALKESEEKYRNLIDLAPDSIMAFDLKGTVVSCNTASARMGGYSKNELVGKHFSELTALRRRDAPKYNRMLRSLVRGNVPKPFEVTWKRKDGTIAYGEIHISLTKSRDRITGFQAIMRDITERKQTEETLKKSEEKFRKIFDSANDCIIFLDCSGRILNVSKKALEVFCGSKKELLGRHFDELAVFYPKDMPALKSSFQRGITGEKTTLNLCIKNKKGRKVHLECVGAPVKIDGKIVGKIVIARDVTERKDAEKIRARARVREVVNERLSALNFYGRKLNAANSLHEVYELTLDAMERTLGFEHAAFLKIEKESLRIKCQRGYPSPLLLKLPLSGAKKGVTVRAANTRRPILVPCTKENKDYVQGVLGIRSELAVPVETEGKIFGVLNVESKRKNAFDERDVTLLQILASHAATAISNLEKRREIEKRSNQLILLMRSSTRIISTSDLQQRLQTIAEAIKELGWRRVVLSVRNRKMEITSPNDLVTAGLTRKEIDLLWSNKPPGKVWEERFGPKYERFRIGEFRYLPWSDPWVREKFSDGTIPSKLSQKEMVDWDPQDLLYAPLQLADGRIVGILSVDDPMDGRQPTEESLAPLQLFIHQAAVAIENAQLIRRLNQAKAQLKADAAQLELKVDERTRELKKSQEKLLKAQKLAAIGELAGMVGHDLRNPLTGIAGAAYYLKSKLAPKADRKSREMLQLIEKDIEYSNKIVNDLLEYSCEQHLELSMTSPKLVLREALSLVEVPEDIALLDLTHRKPRVRIDAQKMKRVFINIIKNSIDAMPKGGTLTISSREENGNLKIAFVDTGTGIAKDVLKKLWIPLFTTKAKGMGLGLPICKRIVEAHGGDISVNSVPDKGTTFVINIPAKDKLRGGEKLWVKTPESLLLTTTKA